MSQPKAKREFKLLKPGVARFYVKLAINTDWEGKPILTSKGDRMMKVCCAVTDENGTEEDVYTNFTDSGYMFLSKLLHCLGIPRNYTPDFVMNDPGLIEGQAGDCVIGIEEYEGKKRNKVTVFTRKLDAGVPVRANTKGAKDHALDDPFNDEIPF